MLMHGDGWLAFIAALRASYAMIDESRTMIWLAATITLKAPPSSRIAPTKYRREHARARCAKMQPPPLVDARA